MRSIGFILVLVFLVKTGFAQAPVVVWTAEDSFTGYDVAVDDVGNVYTMGVFANTIDFDPGPGVFEMTSFGQTDIFIQKLDSGRNFLWAKQIGGPSMEGGFISMTPIEVPGTITVDAENNVIVTALYMDSIDLDPGPSVDLVYSGSGFNSFIVKLDSDGNYIWGNVLLSTVGEVYVNGNAVDTEGNIYSVGEFSGTTDFDPSTDSLNITSQEVDGFIQKLNAQGEHIWTYSISGPDFQNMQAVDVSESTKVYVTGSFEGVVDLDPGIGVTEVSSDSGYIFILKLSTQGDAVWIRNFQSSYDGIDLNLDGNENVYTFCSAEAGLDSDPGSDTVLLEGNDFGLQIHKMDSDGVFRWARMFYTEDSPLYKKMTVDACGSPWVTFGYNSLVPFWASDVDLDPGPDVLNPPYTQGFNSYLVGLDSVGDLIWGGRLEGGVEGLGSDDSGNIYYTGAGADLTKLSTCSPTVGISDGYNDNPAQPYVYPNPSNSSFRVHLHKSVKKITAQVRDVHGRIVLLAKMEDRKSLDIDIDVPPGIYLLRLELDGEPTTLKLIKQ